MESLHRDPLRHISPNPRPGPSVLLLPCQAVATSRTSRAPGPMASLRRRQADAGLGAGQALGLPAAHFAGTRNAAWTSSSRRTDYLSCFPLLPPPPPCADPLLPLLASKATTEFGNLGSLEENKAMTPRGRSWESGASLSLGEKFGALLKPPPKGSVRRHSQGQAVSQAVAQMGFFRVAGWLWLCQKGVGLGGPGNSSKKLPFIGHSLAKPLTSMISFGPHKNLMW